VDSVNVTAFYAYAAKPKRVSRTISATISMINDMCVDLKIQDWKSLNVVGKLVVDEVCHAIDAADLFIGDITTLNHNVLFELGYAIAKGKPTWVTLHTGKDDEAKRQRDLNLITTIGYIGYSSKYELRDRLLSTHVAGDYDSTILSQNEGILLSANSYHRGALIYLNTRGQTAETKELDRAIDSIRMTLIQDDPDQGTGQSLSWYIEYVYSATAVLVHLAAQGTVASVSYAKYSLVAGLAYGFDKQLLILAQLPFRTPVDYRDLTFLYRNAIECVGAYRSWITKIQNIIETGERRRAATLSAIGDIKRINIGHYLAENEKDSLIDYFVDTDAYIEAINASDYLLFVGRKGTGKTANFFVLAQEIGSNEAKHVCQIRPAKYEFEEIFRLFTLSQSKAIQGYLLDAIWKFLVVTELALSVYNCIMERPPHIKRREFERKLIEFVDEYRDSIGADFSTRLEYALHNVCKMQVFEGTRQEKIRVSEILHDTIVGRLREYLGEILSEKLSVAILIDNLDNGWEHRDDLPELADFLLGLISVAGEIAEDFGRERLNKRQVHLSVVAFLRSDIFHYIKKRAREADKIVYSQIKWNDRELLMRVIEKRFEHSLGREATSEEIWRTFFDSHVRGVPTDEYIMARLLPRPRDIIFLCKEALAKAKNRSHTRIEASDVVAAETAYSKYAVELLLSEVSKEYPSLTEDVIYKFLGANAILLEDEVAERLRNGGIEVAHTRAIVDLLVDSNFFGIETEEEQFTYIYDDEERVLVRSKARILREKTGKTRYHIHPAFHPVLDLGQRSPDP